MFFYPAIFYFFFSLNSALLFNFDENKTNKNLWIEY